MQLKTYEAPTIQDALKKIKLELGSNAVIFSSKSIEPPSGGKGKWIKVTAAIESPSLKDNIHTESKSGKNEKQQQTRRETYLDEKTGGFSFTDMSAHPCYRKLLNSGFDKTVSSFLMGEAATEAEKSGNYCLENILLKKIASKIPISGTINTDNCKKNAVAAFIGPTGVGKTTTLAKIAARSVLSDRIRVKIISFDNFRIAASEQLKIYGQIMSIPVSIVSSEEEVINELERSSEFDLVLLDTAGRNYRENRQIEKLNRLFKMLPCLETHLLLSATTNKDCLDATLDCYREGSIDRIIITKVDESINMGNIFNTVATESIPVSYITTGQRVPEDIIPASSEKLSKLFYYGFDYALEKQL